MSTNVAPTEDKTQERINDLMMKLKAVQSQEEAIKKQLRELIYNQNKR
jgi:hypothetical protein